MVVVENQYFPIVDWFKMFNAISDVKIEQYETYQKMSYRNRCIISGSNGLINLTVPLQQGREQKAYIRDVKIDYDQPWQKQHWRAIHSSYSRSPFFEYYCQKVNELIMQRQQFLFDLNLEINNWLLKALRISNVITLTSSFAADPLEQGVQNMRNFWLPKNRGHQSEYSVAPYVQVFEDKFGFLPGLSVLDTLFCKGGI